MTTDSEVIDLVIVVIFDTPPVGRLADASLVGSITDGLIFVVALEKVDKKLFAYK